MTVIAALGFMACAPLEEPVTSLERTSLQGLAAATLACNDSLHSTVLDPIRQAGHGPAGSTVLGLANPYEVLTLGPGQRLDGPVYLFNNATLRIQGPASAGPVVLAGAVYLADHATLQVSGAWLHVPQDGGHRYPLYAADDATVDISYSGVSLGELGNNLQDQIVCGRSHLTLRGNAFFNAPNRSVPAPFAMDLARVDVVGNQGMVELTVDDGVQANVLDTPASQGTVGLYFRVHSPTPATLELSSGPSVTRDVAMPVDAAGRVASAHVSSANVFFGLWVFPGTNLVLRQSNVGLFLVFDRDALVQQVAATPPTAAPETRTLGVSDRSLSLQDTRVSVLNLYLDAPSGGATLSVLGSRLGELTCSGGTASRCLVKDTVIDGSGGFIRTAGQAQLTLATSVVNTYIQAADSSVTRLVSSQMAPGNAQPSIWISSAHTSRVLLEDAFLSGGPNGGPPPLLLSNEGAVSNASLFLPLTSTVVTRPASLSISGTAKVTRPAGATPTAATWSLRLKRADLVWALGGGSATIDSGVLGTLNSATLGAGTYTLSLTVSLGSTVLSEVTRPIEVR